MIPFGKDTTEAGSHRLLGCRWGDSQPSLESSVETNAGWIAQKLAEPYDVRKAWSRWVPELAYGRHLAPPPPDSRHAAVLALLYPSQGQWRLPLIERTTDKTVHSGQVSLPGGAMDPHESPETCALRELEEELGIASNSCRLCGRLTTTYIFASNYLVTPCVAITDAQPNFCPNPSEVASLIELPIDELKNDARYGRHQISRRGVVLAAPHLEFQGHRIWGATSMILAEFVARLG